MTPDINIMRQHVAGLYPYRGWKKRVGRMPDGQVMAIYFREIKKAEKVDQAKKKEQEDGGSDTLPF